jgi:DNA-binding response OmpR family regulator
MSIIEQIRNRTYLLPIIVWTDEFNSDKIVELINYRIDAYLYKNDSIDDVCHEIERVIQKTSSNVEIAIELWLGMQKDKDAVMIDRKSGGSYTANQLIDEVRMGTHEGKKLVDSINKLTINLLFREKEQI